MKKFVASLGLSLVSLTFAASTTFAAGTVEVSSNGALSKNVVKVSDKCVNKIQQTNVTSITNNVVVAGNTGENSANKNVGGSATVTTGDVLQSVDITNNAGSNFSTSDNACCDCLGVTDVLVNENGYKSKNKVKVRSKVKNSKVQTNYGEITNSVVVGGNAGGNSSDKNVSDGSEISTGMVETVVTITNNAGLNTTGELVSL